MPPPVLTPQELAQLEIEKVKQEGLVDTFAALTPAQTARIAELQLIDAAFLKWLLYFNDQIIGQYDSELRALNGVFTPLPIVEQDIIDAANLTGRLLPTPPATALVRVPEFDGGNTSIDPINETQQNIDAQTIEGYLVNGYGSGTATSAATTSVLTPASITLSVTNTLAETIQANDVYLVEDGLDLAVIQVDSIVDGGGADPPFLSDLGITVLVPPTGSITAGANLLVFTGFSDGERTVKVASNPTLQPLMDSLVVDLEATLNLRIASLDVQDIAIGTNQDPDGTTQFTAQLLLNGTARTFIQNYLIGTDISDVGFTSLGGERTSRGLEITSRVGEVLANYTGQSQNYYDERFQFSDDRGNVQRGSLRLQVVAEDVLTTTSTYGASAQATADSYDNILP